MNVPEVALALYYILKAGGFTTGGLNFDAKLRRQSLDPVDLLHGHIGGMDTCARALLAAAELIEHGDLSDAIEERYAGWNRPEAQAMLQGEVGLAEIAERVERENIEPKPVSGRQELLENKVNRRL